MLFVIERYTVDQDLGHATSMDRPAVVNMGEYPHLAACGTAGLERITTLSCNRAVPADT
jgi:hypothetical protein